jgi:Holliday junction resolvase RusA-like endonuclease
MTAITLNLPVCPSANQLFANRKTGGRIITREYEAWRQLAGYALNRYTHTPIHGKVHVTICLPEKTRGDIDNRAKAILDLLVRHKWIDDDRYIKSLHLIRDEGQDMRVDVRAA